MKSMNPDWEYRFYDDASVRDYISRNYGVDYVAYIDAINPGYGAAIADLFRYLVIYKEGGLYLDIKSQATRPLSEVILSNDAFLISQWHVPGWGVRRALRSVPGGEYQQWFIVSSPGHPFLKAATEAAMHNIRRYSSLTDSIGKPAVLRTTGPIAYSLAINPIIGLYPHRIVSSYYDLGFRYSVFSGTEHESGLGRRHYSKVKTALVRGDFTAPVAIPLHIGFRAIRDALRRL
jgi:hypothetical protein